MEDHKIGNITSQGFAINILQIQRNENYFSHNSLANVLFMIPVEKVAPRKFGDADTSLLTHDQRSRSTARVVRAALGVLFFLLIGGFAGSATAQRVDLTGVWRCDDGGLYYIRQRGLEIFWFGEQSPTDPHWSNAAHGEVDSSGQIRLSWADVPKGRIMSGGVLLLQVESGDSLVAVSKTGGFGGSTWTRVY